MLVSEVDSLDATLYVGEPDVDWTQLPIFLAPFLFLGQSFKKLPS